MAGYTWSEWLTDELRKRRLRQADLVRLSDGAVTSPQISRWLGKGERPHPDSVRAVCEALGVPPLAGLVGAGYVTEAELGVTVIERPARGAAALEDRELLDEIARRLERAARPGGPGRSADERVASGPTPLRTVVPIADPATEGADWAAKRRQD